MTVKPDDKKCRNCGKALTHTSIQAEWTLTTIEGKVVLGNYHYCVLCGTLRKDISTEDD